MTNLQVVQAFLDGKAGKSLNMHTDGTRLFSYNTCIAQFDGTKFIINFTRYSPTTSKQRNYLVRELLPSQYTKVEDIRMNTQYLGGL